MENTTQITPGILESQSDFSEFVSEYWKSRDIPQAFALGIANLDKNGNIMDVWYPLINALNKNEELENSGSAAVFNMAHDDSKPDKDLGLDNDFFEIVEEAFFWALGEEGHSNINNFYKIFDSVRLGDQKVVYTEISNLSESSGNIEESWLRLQMLSQLKVKPNEINLDGIFGLLRNLAWTNVGPVPLEQLNDLKFRANKEGWHLHVYSVDKFPQMANYTVPENVRIAVASRVRLGAHLASGTTVMHEGFVNFNAGTLGESMVEGRISGGVVVGDGSDIGGGASIMGTLSGGGKQVVSMGEKNLLGANAGLGISLGDNCIVESGLYLTAGAKVKVPDGSIVSARELSGQSGLLFRRHSQTGAVEAIVTDGNPWDGLNADLHSND